MSLPKYESTTLTGHQGPIHCIAYSLDGNYCLSGSADRTVKLWNPSTGLLVKSYSGHGKDVLGVAIPKKAQDNNRFATCSGDRQVFLWDVSSGKTIRRLEDHSQRVNSIAFNEDTSLIASGSYDATTRLWDLRSQGRKPVQVLDESKDSVECVLIHGHEIITSGVDGFVRTYDVRLGKLTQDQLHHAVTSIRLSNDKNCILAHTLDHTLRLIDRDTGECLMDYKGHQNREYRLQGCFSYTDAHVLSGSEDGRIFAWDLVQGNVELKMQAHKRPVTCLAYHPTEHKMISCSVDGTIKVWETSPSS